jgi:hypothetical protein
MVDRVQRIDVMYRMGDRIQVQNMRTVSGWGMEAGGVDGGVDMEYGGYVWRCTHWVYHSLHFPHM